MVYLILSAKLLFDKCLTIVVSIGPLGTNLSEILIKIQNVCNMAAILSREG